VDDAPQKEGRAFGAPGIEPRWSHGAKDAVGCAYSSSSLLWFTVSRGTVNEIYYPTIDTPQVRDVSFLVSDGDTFAHDEKRHLSHTIEKLTPDALGYRIVGVEKGHKLYRLTKEIIADPHAACLLIRVKLECDDEALLRKLHLYVLVAPHLDGNGWGDSGYCRTFAGRQLLAAKGDRTWVMVGAGVPFLRRSVGYVGRSDGWQDVMVHRQMRWAFDEAPDGNIAMIGELDISEKREFTVGLAFGDSDQNAASTLFQSLGTRYADHKPRFIRQWERATANILPLDKAAGDGGKLYHTSRALLLSHEDKSYPGALIASMSIPWGETKGDEDLGGYHLVWTRDMCNSSSGLMASGDLTTPLRSLIYLACTQRPDGGFYQNFWINGRPYWHGIQLDEVSFPIVLAWRLDAQKALENFDPYDMVLGAARYLINQGPYTPQERWEENAGYSPSTLASNIAGLVCAAEFARARGDLQTAEFILEYADFLESHVDVWTVTSQGELVPGIPRHYIRIHPINVHHPDCDEDPNHGVVPIRNRGPGDQHEFPAKNIIDAGFLELVRYGIRKAGSALMEDSLKVVDSLLKVDTPSGPVWRRYNHDGYGESRDGKPYHGHGIGRAWPLLSGERGHYEHAAGRDITPYVRAMEHFANECGLLPEQVWDEDDRPKQHYFRGKPTGAAMPLMWAHAEYIKLLRTKADGRVFDLVTPVADRYLAGKGRKDLEVWKFNRKVRRIIGGSTLRIQAEAPFQLRVTLNGWHTSHDMFSTPTKLGIHYADVPTHRDGGPVQFTFYWPETGHWEGGDFKVEVEHATAAQRHLQAVNDGPQREAKGGSR
jgi:glucoamylase